MTDRYAEGLRRPLGWSEAFQIAERGFKAWAEKEHNRKWFKRIDGTPIPNDLLVNIAQAFADASIPPDPPPMASEDEANREAFGQDSACYRAFIKWLEENPFLTPTWTDAWRAASLSALSDRQMLVEALEAMQEWIEAETRRRNAVDAYNAKLKACRDAEQFPPKVQAEYYAMSNAEMEAGKKLHAMFEPARAALATAKA